MRQLIAALFLSIFCATAFAGGPQGPSGAIPDLYYIDPAGIGLSTGSPQTPNMDSLALSQTAVQTIDTTKTNLILIALGQSNIGNVAPTAFTPVNGSSLFMLNWLNGKIYGAADPILGTTNVFGAGTNPGNPSLRIADSIVTNAYFQRVYIVNGSVSGTAVAWWNSTSGPPNGEEGNIPAIIIRRISQLKTAAGAAVACGSTNITCVIIWCQGEKDEQLGTGQAAYTNSFNTLVTNTATAGFVGHWYIAKQTYVNGVTSAAVQAAQLALPNGTTIFGGPNADSLPIGNTCGPSANAACRQGDGIHWADNGSYSYAALWVSAMHAGGF